MMKPAVEKTGDKPVFPLPRTHTQVLYRYHICDLKSSTSLTGRVAQSFHQRRKGPSVLELPGGHGIHHRHQSSIHLRLAGAALRTEYMHRDWGMQCLRVVSWRFDKKKWLTRAGIAPKASPKLQLEAQTASLCGRFKSIFHHQVRQRRRRKAARFHPIKADQVCVEFWSII